MHRRLLIVDGKLGFAGGVGIADVWMGNAEDPDHWRETHARIEGPAVRDVLGGFVENWTEATGRILGPTHFPELKPFDEGIGVHVTRSSVTTGSTATAELFYAAITGARERLWLTTAYFTGGRFFMDALADAARRGVDVRILVNGPNVDKEVVRETGQRSYGKLLEAGVRMFEYQPTMLHAKVLIVDSWANIGSSNFDERSFALDEEVNIAMRDAAVLAQIEKRFHDDLGLSEELTLESWKARSLTKKAAEYASALLRQSF
jgi:cardiolipin synthase